MTFLEILENGERRVIPLDKPSVRIGREPDNDVVLCDRRASRRHCVIEVSPDVLLLRDLESHNGTWVGRRRIVTAALKPGSSFRIGKAELSIAMSAAAKTVDEPVEIASPRGRSRRAGRARTKSPEPAATLPSVEEVAATYGGFRAGPLTRQLAPIAKLMMTRGSLGGRPPQASAVKLLDRQARSLSPAAEADRPAVATAAVRQLIHAGLMARASDLHLEPRPGTLGLRVRLDGVMHTLGDIPEALAAAMMNVVKVLAEIDIAKKAIVQEGHFGAEMSGRRVDLRVSFAPSQYGQKLALRLLDAAVIPQQFEALGMEADMAEELRRACQQDAGMIVVAGPTGSGKTTTLYTALRSIDAQRRNVVTIEDPIEYRMPDATQIAIDAPHGVTFASVLAGVLRQDPDVIFVGEIRDRETADLAIQAATTGHLVLTTLHARDTVGAIFRLLDLGCEPYQVANAVTLALAQRLIRVLCPQCKRPWRPDARRVRDLRLDERGATRKELYIPTGCTGCMNTGFDGRMGVFEMMKFSPALRDVILTRPTVSQIRKAAGDWLFRTLSDSAQSRVIQGLTAIEEAERVSGSD